MEEDDANDDYPPDDEARPPVPFPPATALSCERIARADVLLAAPITGADEDEVETLTTIVVAADAAPTVIPEGGVGLDVPPPHLQGRGRGERAYALRKELQNAIYGRVWMALGVRRLPSSPATAARGEGRGPEWEATGETFALKEMPWRRIGELRGNMTEDPINEVQAMQFFRRWYEDQQQQQPAAAGGGEAETAHGEAVRIMTETNVLVPVDILRDRRYLYSVMPFCDGGDLFGTVAQNNEEGTLCTEDEAREFIGNALNGLESLQRANLAHRDISLENMLVHRDACVVIDMGQCARIPRTQERRFLICWENVIGKTLYRPPEAWERRNRDNRGRFFIVRENYDGFTVDLWTVSIVLVFLLTGIPPWDQALPTDQRFLMGCYQERLRVMMESWDIHLTDDAFDLLQRCLRRDPRRRLSLGQIRAHPWINLGAAPAQIAAPDPPHTIGGDDDDDDEGEPMEM